MRVDKKQLSKHSRLNLRQTNKHTAYIKIRDTSKIIKRRTDAGDAIKAIIITPSENNPDLFAKSEPTKNVNTTQFTPEKGFFLILKIYTSKKSMTSEGFAINYIKCQIN